MTSEGLAAIGAAVGVILSILALWKGTDGLRVRIRRGFTRTGRAVDVVLGTPAMPDPDRPGQFLRPELPDIGVRITQLDGLVKETLFGQVEEARTRAQAAVTLAEAAHLESKAARIEMQTVREEVQTVRSEVGDLSGQFGRFVLQVGTWQDRDRVQKETATAVLHEIGMTLPLPPRPTRPASPEEV